MLKKSFYDWFTIIFIVVLVVGIGLILYSISSNYNEQYKSNTQNCANKGLSGSELIICLRNQNNPPINLIVVKITLYILGFIYYILILILAIQLHSRKKLSLINVIIIAVIIPLAPIYYLTALRKPLKNIEKEPINY